VELSKGRRQPSRLEGPAIRSRTGEQGGHRGVESGRSGSPDHWSNPSPASIQLAAEGHPHQAALYTPQWRPRRAARAPRPAELAASPGSGGASHLAPSTKVEPHSGRLEGSVHQAPGGWRASLAQHKHNGAPPRMESRRPCAPPPCPRQWRSSSNTRIASLASTTLLEHPAHARCRQSHRLEIQHRRDHAGAPHTSTTQMKQLAGGLLGG